MSDRVKFRLFDSLLVVLMTILTGMGAWACVSIISLGESRAETDQSIETLQDKDDSLESVLAKLESAALKDADLMKLKVEVLADMQKAPRWVEEKFDQILDQQREMRTDIREMKNRLDKGAR